MEMTASSSAAAGGQGTGTAAPRPSRSLALQVGAFLVVVAGGVAAGFAFSGGGSDGGGGVAVPEPEADAALKQWSVPEVNVLPTTPGRVVIVGAGASGLAAARALQANDVEVVVLEARDRAGGRMWGTDVGAGRVDLGAAFIHGVNGSPLADIMQANGLGWAEEEEGDIVFVAEGDADFDLFGFIRYEGSFSEQLSAGTLSGPSYADAIDEWVENEGYTGDEERRARWSAGTFTKVVDGAALDELAPAQFYVDDYDAFAEEANLGSDRIPDGSYVEVVDMLAEPLDIRYGVAVDAIAWDGDGVTVTAGDDEYAGSHVIVSVPLGVLKAGSIDFDGGLPQAKLDAIERMGFGTVERVVLTYDTVWWGGGGIVYADDTGRFPVVVDFTAFTGAPTLIFIYGGPAAAAVQADLSDDEILAAARAVVLAAFGEDPEPAATAVSHWASDEYARGAYTFASVDASPADHTALAAPVDDRVLFAGESTVDPAWTATIPGAILSGLREARRLGVGPDLGIPGTEGH